MLRSLGAKLVASYCLVILLCLLLAGSGSVYFLRDYQRQIKLNQLSDLAQPLSWQVRLLERSGASPEQIGLFLRDRASEMDVRLLLVDSGGLVVEDTDGSLRGERILTPSAWQPRERPQPDLAVVIGSTEKRGFVFIAAPGHPVQMTDDRFVVRASSFSVVLAVPEQSLTASWLDLAPSLTTAALVSLIVSIGVAVLLSRSIARPVAEMTRAAEEIARGRYDQHIPVRSRDEVGRLSEAFNHMARQVSSSHRTLRDFLANVSHELRTPLTSIQGFSQAMVDGTVRSPAEYGEASRIINDEADRMREMVEDLLLLSKIESGQMPMDRTTLDLRELLKACIRRAASQARQAGMELVLKAHESVEFAGDERRLEQLLRNLMENALRHTPRGGTITLRLLSEERAQSSPGTSGRGSGHRNAREVRIVVHNTGSYIPEKDQERIFERFYQVDSSRAHNGDGSGLGLAIAREIAHAHGGLLAVESHPESGTAFTLTFRG